MKNIITAAVITLAALTCAALPGGPTPPVKLGGNTNDVFKSVFFSQNSNAPTLIDAVNTNASGHKWGTNLYQGFLPAWSTIDPSSVGGGSSTNFNGINVSTNATFLNSGSTNGSISIGLAAMAWLFGGTNLWTFSADDGGLGEEAMYLNHDGTNIFTLEANPYGDGRSVFGTPGVWSWNSAGQAYIVQVDGPGYGINDDGDGGAFFHYGDVQITDGAIFAGDVSALSFNSSTFNGGIYYGDATGVTNLLGSGMAALPSTNATLDFPSTTAAADTTLTTPLSGVTTNAGWAINVTPVQAVMNGVTNGTWFGWVSSNGVVSIRFSITSAAAIDPPAGLYTIVATKFSH